MNPPQFNVNLDDRIITGTLISNNEAFLADVWLAGAWSQWMSE